jgi:hypothetical protein
MTGTSTATTSKQPALRARGTVRISLPAHVANDAKRLKHSIGGLVEALGCRSCFSGADCFFSAQRDFVVNPEGKLAAASLHSLEGNRATVFLNPQPEPPGKGSTVTVAMGNRVQFDIDKVFQAIDQVISTLGSCPCHSGFDVQYLNEVSVIGISNELQAVQYGV